MYMLIYLITRSFILGHIHFVSLTANQSLVMSYDDRHLSFYFDSHTIMGKYYLHLPLNLKCTLIFVQLKTMNIFISFFL